MGGDVDENVVRVAFCWPSHLVLSGEHVVVSFDDNKAFVKQLCIDADCKNHISLYRPKGQCGGRAFTKVISS